jgi:ribonuclease HII
MRERTTSLSAARRRASRYFWALDDSKKLSEAQREEIFAQLAADPAVRWAAAAREAAEIDASNILAACEDAMAAAVRALSDGNGSNDDTGSNGGAPCAPDAILVDGARVPPSLAPPAQPAPVSAVVKGDAKCSNIAAASIVAKVLRDRRMAALDALFPGYGFSRHKGYGTAEHRDSIARLGAPPSPRPRAARGTEGAESPVH